MEQMHKFKDQLRTILPHPCTAYELNTDESEIQEAVAKFQALCGLDDDSAPELLAAAEIDVREDAYLFLALMTCSPIEFAEWFESEDPEIYEMTSATGYTDWAEIVSARAKMIAALFSRFEYN